MDNCVKVYDIVRQIPIGKVATYGQVAAIAGMPKNARFVGYALGQLNITNKGDIPWQRVVNAQGKIPMRDGIENRQKQLLEAEGIIFNSRGNINMLDYQWDQ